MFAPTFNEMGDVATPDVTTTPFTVMVSFLPANEVAVTVVEVTEFETVTE